MIKENKKKVVLVSLGLFLLVGWFYWFQYRPAKIRHDCSWVKHHSDAVSARPAITEEELKVKGKLKDCSYIQNDSKYYGIFERLNSKSMCEAGNKEIIEEYKQPKPAESEKDWWVEATDEEYKFCLHNRGL